MIPLRSIALLLALLGPGWASAQETPLPSGPRSAQGALLDGHRREGAFLAGPGSMAFVLHHTLLGGLGGLGTQVSWTGSNLEVRQREAMLVGGLVGAGLGFGVSSWWQFNHWTDSPVAGVGVLDSFWGGMLLAGLCHLVTADPTLISWSAVIGAEVGAWLTVVTGGGEMPLDQALFISSGAGWGLAYAALLLAIVRASGTSTGSQGVTDTLLIAPGLGAGALALASLRFHPSTAQVVRADLFGAGVGAVVLLLSSLVLADTRSATPYVLSLLSSAGAIGAVSLLWAEEAVHSSLAPAQRPYRRVWW